MTTIETKEARLNELKAELAEIRAEMKDDSISNARWSRLQNYRYEIRCEIEKLQAEIDAEIEKVAAQKVDAILTSDVQPVIVNTTFKNNRCSVNIDGAKVSLDKATQILFESELAKGGENVLLINENSDVCPLDEDLFILGKHNVKTAIRQFARGEKVTGAKVLNGKFYPVVKANAEPAVEETAIVETVNAKEQSTNTESANENSENNAELVNQLKTFNAKVRGLSCEEFLAENAGLPIAEYREQKAAAENGIAKLEIEFKIEDIKSEIGRLESENYYTARNLYGIVVLEKHYATDESLQAYAAELVDEFNDRLGKINEAQAELATLAPATAETANVEESDGYNPDVFSLLPKLEDLNDVDGEFDEDAAEYTDRDDRYNRGEKIAADLTSKLRPFDPTVEVTYTIDEDEDTYYLSYDGIIRTPFTATGVEASFHAMKQREAKPEAPTDPEPKTADVKKVSAVVYYTCADDKSNWVKDKYFETTPAAAEWILSFVKTRVFDCTVRDAEIIDLRNGRNRYVLTDADITAINAVNTEQSSDTVAAVARICATVNAAAPEGWEVYYDTPSKLFTVTHNNEAVARLTSVELYDAWDAHPPEDFFDAYDTHDVVEFDDDGNISAIWF